jgi:hypothetical protein
MPRYQTTIRTPWSTDRAFDYLSDLEHFAEWDPGVRHATRIDGAPGAPGSRYAVTVKGPGRSLTLRYEITSAERPHRVEIRAESPTLVSVDVMTFADRDDSGCDVSYDARLDLRGLLRAANPLLALGFRRIGDRAAAGLRRALEGEFVPAGAPTIV